MLIKAIAALPVFFLTVALAQMQPGQTGKIRVQIPVPFGRALGHIQVILQNTNGWMAIPFEHVGNFEAVEFGALAIGSYEVLVNAEGFEPVRWPVGVGDGVRTVVVTIPLKEEQKRQSGPVANASSVDVTELSRRYPKKAVQDYEKAVDENRKGNYDKALTLLKSVVELAPDLYSAHNTLGTVYQKMNRYREAEDEYKRARELSPGSDEPLVNLGGLYVQESDDRASEGAGVVGKILEDARALLEQALNMKQSSMAYYLLARPTTNPPLTKMPKATCTARLKSNRACPQHGSCWPTSI